MRLTNDLLERDSDRDSDSTCAVAADGLADGAVKEWYIYESDQNGDTDKSAWPTDSVSRQKQKPNDQSGDDRSRT